MVTVVSSEDTNPICFAKYFQDMFVAVGEWRVSLDLNMWLFPLAIIYPAGQKFESRHREQWILMFFCEGSTEQLRPLLFFFRAFFHYPLSYQRLPSLRDTLRDDSLPPVSDILRLSLLNGETQYTTIYQEYEDDGGDMRLGDVGDLCSGRFIQVANIMQDLIREGLVKQKPVVTRQSYPPFLGWGGVESAGEFTVNGCFWFVHIIIDHNVATLTERMSVANSSLWPRTPTTSF